MKIIVSIDLGTTKICVAGVDAGSLRPLAVVSCENDADISGLTPGLHEQCPLRMWQIVCELIQSLPKQGIDLSDVEAVSISGQMHGVLLIDSSGEPVGNFITWRDQRGNPQPWAKQYAAANGCELHAGYGGATLSTLADEGKLLRDLHAISLADFIAYKLSGVIATEVTHAASWGIYDIQNNCWNNEMLERLGIPAEILCDVKPSAGILDKISADTSKILSLPAETKICSPVGDNQASVIGASGFSSTAMVLNLGTGGQVSIPDSQGNYCDGFETRPMPTGGFIHVGASLCGGWSYNYLKDFCRNLIKKIAGVELADTEIYAKLNELALANETSHGLQVDTLFAGVRGDGSIRGCIDGLDTHNFTIENLSRGFLEGMVGELFNMAEGLLDNVDSVVASGNAIRKNPLMPKLIEQIFSKKFIASTFEEEAAVGAAGATAVELGLIDKAEVSQFLRSE